MRWSNSNVMWICRIEEQSRALNSPFKQNRVECWPLTILLTSPPPLLIQQRTQHVVQSCQLPVTHPINFPSAYSPRLMMMMLILSVVTPHFGWLFIVSFAFFSFTFALSFYSHFSIYFICIPTLMMLLILSAVTSLSFEGNLHSSLLSFLFAFLLPFFTTRFVPCCVML